MWIFRKFGVPLDGLHFPMSPNNKIGAKCLNNFHLKLNDNGVLEDANEQVDIVDSDKEQKAQKNEEGREEKEEEELEKKDQEPVPSATTERVEACSLGEQGEALSKGEAEEQGEDVEDENDDIDDSDEEIQLPVQKKPVTPRKSRRLASKGKHPVVTLDDDTSSHNTLEPTSDAPPSPKPATPPSHQIPSPPPSPIPFTLPLVTTHTSPGLGFTNSSSVPTAPLDSILLKLNDL
ncbi:uncharacterized protein LOC130805673 [Amaranthus tricolor]|uniref:uncharacterized protein LOC130805673 n=1 Tax=Amaranthus tricolor TaxID=29722 RepID=UPI0025874562|nr:uncharacterized protein LOC130805673 [Amaranthus tricolor]